MLIRIVPCLVLAVLLGPALLVAQEPAAPAPARETPAAPSRNGDVQLELAPRRHILLPRPPMDTVVRDAEDAREAVLAEPRREEILREMRERPVLRPDLDHAVTGGIQTREIHRALPR